MQNSFLCVLTFIFRFWCVCESGSLLFVAVDAQQSVSPAQSAAERGWEQGPKLSQCALRHLVGMHQHQKADGWKCFCALGWAILSMKNKFYLTSELACRLRHFCNALWGC